MARDSIPVPSSQQSRQQQSTRQAVNQAARDQQPPWRSSLDLVWSYSRSQAFYGDNLGTSPSFVDRHWAGPTRRDENGQLIEDSLDEYDEDEDGSEYLEEYSGTEADSAEENDNDETAAGAMEWEGEQLPRNALSSGSNSGMNGRRRSGGGRSSRRRNSNSKRNSTSSGPRDRRISRLEDEESLDEERSRSRSRSPKRLGSGGNLRRDQHKEGSYLNPNRTNSYSSSSDSNSNYSNKRNSKDLNSNSIANENTPLLSTNGRKGSNGFLSANRRSISGTSSTGSSGYKSSLRLQYGQGTSTFLQSWFNTLNALVGVGILALPLAFSYSGWIGGTVLFLICGGLTNYTGKVLAKIMSKEPGLKTYSDIGAYAFGANARLVVSLLFCLELWAVSVALIILFGDSVYAMFGGYLTPAAFKAIGLAIILPTIFLPLNVLSPVSVIGIVSTFTLFGVVLLDGLIKKEAPGSLWQPATTHLLPEWSRFPLSFGLIMSGFSSHPIIPSLYKDMRDPRKFSKMLNLAYVGATIIYLSMGMVGYAMFGYKVSGEITQDLSRTPGYPHFLNKMAIWLIALNPLTKFALATRPINTTFESLFGLEALFIPLDSNFKKNSNFSGGRMANADENGVINPDVNLETEQANGNGNASGSNITGETSPTPTQQNDNPLAGSAIALRSAERTKAWSPGFKLACRLGLRLLIAGLITVTAIVLPGFEKVMAFLGAFLASSTCVFGPLLANLKLFHSSMSRTRIAIDVFILAAVFCFAVIGTVWTFMNFD